MPDKAPYTRRQFLQHSLVLASTIGSVPGFLNQAAAAMHNPGDALSSRPGVPEGRVLVVIQLSGGNDGLNTVIPFGQDNYYKQRPRLAVKPDDAIVLDKQNGIGLNPAMKSIAELIDQGLGNVILGAGYPNPNRSHFASMDIWHTGDALDGKGYGWIGKALDEQAETQPKANHTTACISIGSEAPRATQGKQVKPIALDKPHLFRWFPENADKDLAAAYEDISDTRDRLRAVDPDDASAYVMRTTLDAQIASDRIRKAAEQKPETTFPRSGLGDQLKLIAAMIKAEMPTRVYYAAMGGFDTHAGQLGRHPRLLTEFADAVKAFQTEMNKAGHADRVLTMAFSEFGRRVGENASGGTDHGAAGPMFLFGNMVETGIVGKHPSLADLDKGDLKYTTDFRQVYAAVLDQWMKADSAAVLGKKFETAKVLGEKVKS